MTLCAHGGGAIRGQIRRNELIRTLSSRGHCLAHFVASFQDVVILRSVRTVGARAPILAIVITVVAVRAEYPSAHGTACRDAIDVEHLRAQAWLPQRARPPVHHRICLLYTS